MMNTLKDKSKMTKQEIGRLLEDDAVIFRDFYDTLCNAYMGNWDNIEIEENLYDYIGENMRDVPVGHILEVIEKNKSINDVYKMDLGSLSNTPIPINTKADLLDALDIDLCE